MKWTIAIVVIAVLCAVVTVDAAGTRSRANKYYMARNGFPEGTLRPTYCCPQSQCLVGNLCGVWDCAQLCTPERCCLTWISWNDSIRNKFFTFKVIRFYTYRSISQQGNEIYRTFCLSQSLPLSFALFEINDGVIIGQAALAIGTLVIIDGVIYAIHLSTLLTEVWLDWD